MSAMSAMSGLSGNYNNLNIYPRGSERPPETKQKLEAGVSGESGTTKNH